MPTRTPGYEGRIGRYGPALAEAFLAAAEPRYGRRALDVGCGQGALSGPLSRVCGEGNVVALDPSSEMLAACRAAVPTVAILQGSAEALPLADRSFDAVLAQLVVPLLEDPHRGAREMARVTVDGGIVAACVWDFADGMTVLRTFWDAATSLDAGAAAYDQGRAYPFITPSALSDLWHEVGLRDVRTGGLAAEADYRDFDDLWEPLVAPDGTPGRYYGTLAPPAQERLRQDVDRRLGSPRGPFTLSARAWYVVGTR
jgi:SAM-dependent methyltransferase